MKTSLCLITVAVTFTCAFIAGYTVCYKSTISEPIPDYSLKLRVVNPWGGPKGPYGRMGETVGYLYVNTSDRDEPSIYFIHKGDVCKYGGDMGWEALARAVYRKDPIFQIKIVK